ncbi:MAG: serine protease [Gammaproteobacteria bacterium]|nr:serine protease [Gammaproteobacteria bacterium]
MLAILLGYRNFILEQRVVASEARLSAFEARFLESGLESLAQSVLENGQSKLDTLLQAALNRVDALEARSTAVSRVIGSALPSIMFLQVAYRFEDEDTGEPLRFLVGPDGEPLMTPAGPAMSLKGKGPIVERQLTGTAFVATEDRLLVTNRHLVRPWEDDEAAAVLASRGFKPVLYRLVGYLPGKAEPIEVEVAGISEEADVAILKSDALPPHIGYLDLNPDVPGPGDSVIVMGYPTGIQALVARAGHRLVDELREADDVDFWQVARQLSDNEHINPLASLGIVGQVSETFVVYDAETAQGGSGGPVLGLDGRVVAINAAVIPGFNGSNLGVPVERAVKLIEGLKVTDEKKSRPTP